MNKSKKLATNLSQFLVHQLIQMHDVSTNFNVNKHFIDKMYEYIKNKCYSIIEDNCRVNIIIKSLFPFGVNNIVNEYYGCESINFYNYLKTIFDIGIAVGSDPYRLSVCTCANAVNNELYTPYYINSNNNNCRNICDNEHYKIGYNDQGEYPCEQCSVLVYDDKYINRHNLQRYRKGLLKIFDGKIYDMERNSFVI